MATTAARTEGHIDCDTAPGAAEAAGVAAFRRRYRDEAIGRRYSGWGHFAFTTGTCLAIIAEYLGHRGPMHHPRRGLRLIYERHARQHHRFFTDANMAFDSARDFKAVLFPPILIIFFTLCFFLPMGLLIGWLATANAAWLFVATGVGYFLNYELFHFAYHMPESSAIYRLPGLKALRRLHHTHHRRDLMALHNFNITYPIGDRLFGTLYPGDTPPREGRRSKVV